MTVRDRESSTEHLSDHREHAFPPRNRLRNVIVNEVDYIDPVLFQGQRKEPRVGVASAVLGEPEIATLTHVGPSGIGFSPKP